MRGEIYAGLSAVLILVSSPSWADSSQEDTQWCNKIATQAETAAEFRVAGISEVDAYDQMGRILKDHTLAESMRAAILVAYERYPTLTSGQVKTLSYQQCLRENAGRKAVIPPAKPVLALDMDKVKGIPEYREESAETLLIGTWTCRNNKNAYRWEETLKDDGTFEIVELTDDKRQGSGSYRVSDKVATYNYEAITENGRTEGYYDRQTAYLYYASPNRRLNNMDGKLDDCTRVK